MLLSQQIAKFVGKLRRKMSCPPKENLDPRVRRTRKLLQDALRALTHEKQFSAITVQDITERATVNRATFYAHYLDKYDLVSSIFRTDLQNTLHKCFESRPVFNHENLVVVSVAIFEFMGDMYKACPKTTTELQDSVGHVLQEELYDMMSHWVSATANYAQLFPDCTKETVATVLVGSIYGGAYRWSRAANKAPAREVCQEIVSILLPRSNNLVGTWHAMSTA